MRREYNLQFYYNGQPTLTAIHQSYSGVRKLLKHCNSNDVVRVTTNDGTVIYGKAEIVLMNFPKLK